jgi:uncharacterized protein YhfF
MAHMTVADLGIATKVFWANFLQSQTNPSATAERLYDTFRIGDSPESANEGAQLIIAGIKTTTSSLLWEYEKLRKPLPFIGSLSILEDGQGEPVCIVETIWLKVLPFEKIDVDFAVTYGEWGDTLPAWQQHAWRYYCKQCGLLGRAPTLQMPLVCERFKVVYAR